MSSGVRPGPLSLAARLAAFRVKQGASKTVPRPSLADKTVLPGSESSKQLLDRSPDISSARTSPLSPSTTPSQRRPTGRAQSSRREGPAPAPAVSSDRSDGKVGMNDRKKNMQLDVDLDNLFDSLPAIATPVQSHQRPVPAPARASARPHQTVYRPHVRSDRGSPSFGKRNGVAPASVGTTVAATRKRTPKKTFSNPSKARSTEPVNPWMVKIGSQSFLRSNMGLVGSHAPSSLHQPSESLLTGASQGKSHCKALHTTPKPTPAIRPQFKSFMCSNLPPLQSASAWKEIHPALEANYSSLLPKTDASANQLSAKAEVLLSQVGWSMSDRIRVASVINQFGRPAASRASQK